ncbi:hypothetical protein [Runella slithyformis]|uniref:DUF4450 domain-containing protein n=1 Tax=Runella slithyformis (strain ATCC 29530 / DSM 19594 / LMG 11500 / NCIMB 11436 / LSU 4) TaxID=761193 RepID=A0A7U3ZGX7_RUNSL|nr:hypothetical protein [Runella slithyformis]AEI47018.1 hypothetical protein Runsl_0575 [Runella slithyformis DSM 19594]
MSIKNTLLCFLVSLLAFAQKPLNFAEMLTYEYVQEGQKKEFSVYFDRQTSTWLFTNADSFGATADGLEFVVAYPNGRYLVCGTDDVGQKFCQTFDSPLARKNTPKISGKALGKSRVFGQNNYGWPTLKGQLYQLNAGRMTQEVYAATVPFDCRPLYAYNSLLGIEHYLPVFQQMDYPSYLPKNQLVLFEQSPLNVKLLSISPTEYFINLSEYKRIK